jgi:endonuclease I
MACALENYYSAVSWEPLVGSALLSSLHTQISAGTSSIPYTSSTATDVWDALEILDSDPDVPGNIIEIYSQRSVLASDHVDASGWNREHVWPKSYGVGYSGPDFTDLHSLRAADWSINSARGNKWFGECDPARDATCSTPAHAEAAADTAANPAMFMPPASVRGDLARSLFFMAARYCDTVLSDSDDDSTIEALVLSRCPEPRRFAMGNLTVLLKWHEEDPPDAREAWRTEQVQI